DPLGPPCAEVHLVPEEVVSEKRRAGHDGNPGVAEAGRRPVTDPKYGHSVERWARSKQAADRGRELPLAIGRTDVDDLGRLIPTRLGEVERNESFTGHAKSTLDLADIGQPETLAFLPEVAIPKIDAVRIGTAD